MTRRPNRHTGFTLVELLIAVAITVLIVVLLGTMFGSLTRVTSRANQRIDAFRDARAALQMMERDLTGLVHAQQTPYLALDNLWNDPNDPTYSARTNASNLQVFALVAAKNKAPGVTTENTGDVCAVGYYCAWEDSKHAYSLRRFFRNSKDIYAAIKPQVTGTTLGYTTPAALYTPAANDDVLASYVWNLRIVAYKSDGTQDTTYPGGSRIVNDPANPGAAAPAAIEISFSAISPEAARTV